MTDGLDLPLHLLDWYREMGVDAALGGDAVDWLARGEAKPGAAFEMPQHVEARQKWMADRAVHLWRSDFA